VFFTRIKLQLGTLILVGPFVSIEFPYRYKESPFGRLPDPLATIFVCTWYGWRPFDFLVDSGADVTMVPKSLAEWVGVDLKKLPRLRSYGVEGKGVQAHHGSLRIRVSKDEFTIPCLFSSQERTPLLLGRAGLFNRFTIVFDNKLKSIHFRPL
jgi:hypothetical protein